MAWRPAVTEVEPGRISRRRGLDAHPLTSSGEGDEEPEGEGEVGPEVELVEESVDKGAGHRSGQARGEGDGAAPAYVAVEADDQPEEGGYAERPHAQRDVEQQCVRVGRIDLIGVRQRRVDVARIEPP